MIALAAFATMIFAVSSNAANCVSIARKRGGKRTYKMDHESDALGRVAPACENRVRPT